MEPGHPNGRPEGLPERLPGTATRDTLPPIRSDPVQGWRDRPLRVRDRDAVRWGGVPGFAPGPAFSTRPRGTLLRVIVSILVGFLLIFAGLSGNFVFRGTNASWPLVLLGIFVIGRALWYQQKREEAEERYRRAAYESMGLTPPEPPKGQAVSLDVILLSLGGMKPERAAKLIAGFGEKSRDETPQACCGNPASDCYQQRWVRDRGGSANSP